MKRQIPQVLLILALTAGVYAIDVSTGLVPDVSGLYLIPVVLAAYWFGLLPSLIVAVIALSADFILHPDLHKSIAVVHTVIHMMTYSFAAFVTALLRRQLSTIRALSSRRDYELDLARRLHDIVTEKHLVPTAEPLDVAVKSVPSRELGGDQVFIRSTEQGLFACIADISGKGVSAALFAPLLHAQINDAVDANPQPQHVITRVNAGMHATLPPDMFLTMFCCLIHSEELTFVNAGHEPGYVIDSESLLIELLSKDGLPVGVQEELAIEPRTCRFATGSLLLCYSDGITDSEGFGGDRERIRAFLGSTYPTHASDVADRLLEHASSGGHPQRDDMSLLVVRAV